MKIVIDTNMIIASFATRGFCNELLEICLTNHEIYTSNFILDETERIFKDKIKLPSKIIREIIQYLKSSTKIVIPVEISTKDCRDKNDLQILGTALSANADIIISGDKDLLVLKKYKNILILSPRKFWEYIQ